MKRIRLCLLLALVLPALLGMPDTYAGGEDALIISTMENLQDPEKQISSFGLSDVIVLKDETAEKNQAAARNALASGKLVVFRSTQMEKKQIADYLGISYGSGGSKNPYYLAMSFVQKINERYIFGDVYLAFDSTVSPSRSNAICANEEVFIQCIDSARNSINKSAAYAARSGSNPSRTDTATLIVYGDGGTDVIGEGYITQDIYDRGYYTVDGTRQFVFDARSMFEAAPNSNCRVYKYICRMHANVTGHTVLHRTDLPSDISYSGTVSLGPESIGGQFSWQYNPDSQTITKQSSSSGRVCDWICEPVPRYGHSWTCLPGLRVVTTNGSGSRGAFSRLTIPTRGFSGANESYTVEAGRWF